MAVDQQNNAIKENGCFEAFFLFSIMNHLFFG